LWKFDHRTMTTEKQEQALKIFEQSKKYYVSAGNGTLYSYRRATNSYEPVIGNHRLCGYVQHTLYGGRGKAEKVLIYAHILVWIVTYGTYDNTRYTVKHKDKNFSNNAASNLYLHGEVDENGETKVKYVPRKIREQEIEEIKALVIEGKGASAIAKKLNLDVNRVAYAVRKIKGGNLLRFDKRNAGKALDAIQREPIFKLPE
jgi:hypothetical protein